MLERGTSLNTAGRSIKRCTRGLSREGYMKARPRGKSFPLRKRQRRLRCGGILRTNINVETAKWGERRTILARAAPTTSECNRKHAAGASQLMHPSGGRAVA